MDPSMKGPAELTGPEVVQRLAALAERVGRGDEDALAGLRELLREPELWKHAEGLAGAVQADWLGHLTAEGFAADEGTMSTSATPPKGRGRRALERLLAGYVEACGLHTRYAEARAAVPALPPPLAAELRKRVAAAHRRWRLAGKRVELVRRLLV